MQIFHHNEHVWRLVILREFFLATHAVFLNLYITLSELSQIFPVSSYGDFEIYTYSVSILHGVIANNDIS